MVRVLRGTRRRCRGGPRTSTSWPRVLIMGRWNIVLHETGAQAWFSYIRLWAVTERASASRSGQLSETTGVGLRVGPTVHLIIYLLTARLQLPTLSSFQQ